MTGRSLRSPGFPAVLLLFALAVFTLAAAPVVAAQVLPSPHEMGPAADASCHGGQGSSHTQGTHAEKCLAICLAVHGGVLPDMPVSGAGQGHHSSIVDADPAKVLVDHSSGLDPPPPRTA